MEEMGQHQAPGGAVHIVDFQVPDHLQLVTRLGGGPALRQLLAVLLDAADLHEVLLPPHALLLALLGQGHEHPKTLVNQLPTAWSRLTS